MKPLIGPSAIRLMALAATGLAIGQDVQAATLYVCKPYSGSSGLYWSQLPCSQQQAASVQTHEVPGHLTLVQQVELVQSRQAAKPPPPVPAPQGATGFDDKPVPSSERECEHHANRIRQLNQIERQVRTSMSYEAIAFERNVVLDRMAALRCRQRAQ